MARRKYDIFIAKQAIYGFNTLSQINWISALTKLFLLNTAENNFY